MAYLDCARMDNFGVDLLGRGEKVGLVELVGDGILLLKNVHKVRVEERSGRVRGMNTGAGDGSGLGRKR